MVQSAVTVCLVPEARRGPFVFHGDLPGSCAAARELGFDGIEIFAPSGSYVAPGELKGLLAEHGLRLAAVGTGAGMILHGLSLSDSDSTGRERACAYVREMIAFGAPFGAPAIIGSMQGRTGAGQTPDSALLALERSLRELAAYAAERDQMLLFEPLNRYETDLINTVAHGADLRRAVEASNLRILADLFHMNIEEASIEESVLAGSADIGHIHFADSNRRAVGFGHTRMDPVARALAETGFSGFASAEVFPFPDSRGAAERTATSFRKFFRKH